MISNSRVKYIQSLGHKKYRDEAGVFIAEGPKLVMELLQAGVSINHLYALDEWADDNRDLLKDINAETITVKELERISQLVTPNQVIALVKKFDLPKTIAVKGKISLALDEMQDPGNLGTIIRTADWFGIENIVCSENSADVYNPKVVQSTMGSIARVNVFYADLKEWLSGQKNIPVYATTLDGKDISKMTAPAEGIIVIGNESKGISEEILGFAGERITIPKKGKAESLNAAVAAGIILSFWAK
jgi:TrmH family RNA methyltransferase